MFVRQTPDQLRCRHGCGQSKFSRAFRVALHERDGWRCRLCGDRLARTRQVPHPKAPTVDHIVPRSLGGSDNAANLQSAHFRCNALKSNTGAGDQLALLG